MNCEKANEWLKQIYPQLEGYRVQALSYFMYHSVCLQEEETEGVNNVRISTAPDGFVYAIASSIKGVLCGDVILLIPEDV